VPKFCANLSMMFTELPFADRFAAAAAAGFKGVEYLFPYDYEAREVAGWLKAAGLRQVLFNMPPGDWGAGERGIAALPDRVDEFRRGVLLASEYATALGCGQVHCMAGLVPAGTDARLLHDTYVANLAFAAAHFADRSLRVLIEPINTRDMPGYFLTRTQQALDVIAAVGAGNLLLQYDCYHMQIMEGDLTPTIARNLGAIGHIQAADTPGRHEPGTGEINYPFVFEELDRLGYQGWVGCEYKPRGETLPGLAWARDYLA
jgi:hydroxypyruvate isomerase